MASLLFLEIFTTIVYKLSCDKLLEKRKMSCVKQTLVWCAFFCLCNGLTYGGGLPPAVNGTIFMATLLAALELLYQASHRQKLLLTAVFYLLGVGAEGIAFAVTALLLPENGSAMTSLLVSKLLWFAAVRAVPFLWKGSRAAEQVSMADWLETLMIPLFSAVIAVSVLGEGTEYGKWAYLLSMMLLVGINLLSFLLYERVRENAGRQARMDYLEKTVEQYLSMSKEMGSYYEELRYFKHDLKQRYLLEQTYLEQKNYGKLQESYQESLQILNQEKLLSRTGNPYIDNIVNYKALLARKENVKMEAEMSVASDAAFSEADVCFLLGNLIDNAIEAAVKSQDKSVRICVRMKDGNLFIDIENTKEPLRNETAEKKRTPTTKDNPREHGMGLAIIHNIVEKYHGELQIREEEQRFRVQIWLFDIETA